MQNDQERIFEEIDLGIAALQAEIDNISNAAEILTGGLSIDEVLNPEGSMEDIEHWDSVEEEAVADLTPVTENNFPEFFQSNN